MEEKVRVPFISPQFIVLPEDAHLINGSSPRPSTATFWSFIRKR
jgi:hypothetical protein